MTRPKETKKKFFASLKTYLPKEIPPAAVGRANMAREIEYHVYDALCIGDFDRAQAAVDNGADLNRCFDFPGLCPEPLLSYVTQSSRYPDGAVGFLLRNGAKPLRSSVDNALYFGRSDEEIRLLIQYGAPVSVDLALYRSLGKGRKILIDLFLDLGGQVNVFMNGLPIIYGAQYCPEAWNYMIDLGAKGCFNEDLPRKRVQGTEWLKEPPLRLK
ncbi:MAG: hypothetical protein JSS34_04695 [Proteobacteria bacterium]|nr:hypothetical protein [Pseudomonadota bacterium]